MLRSQTQIAWLKIATAFSWLKVLKNFEVLINEITYFPWRVCICIVSVCLFIYLSIYLSTYLYLDMYASISLSIILSISLYMIIIKQYCFQIEQLKLWQKQNILYFENDIILW